MRRNSIRPAAHHIDEHKNEEVGSFRDKRTNNAAKRSHGHGAEKKIEALDQTKKLQKKPIDDIDASAEAFIKNFRQQLLIQRLQSVENYEQMLAKGLAD